MRIAIMETILTPGGHEVDFDRILAEEFTALGHEVVFYVPEEFVFRFDYKLPVRYLPGASVSYTGHKGVGKLVAAAKREFNRQRWYRGLYAAAVRGEFDAAVIPTSTYRYLRALNLNRLKRSPVPLIFIQHGLNPREVDAYFREAARLMTHPRIKMAVLTFGDTIFGRSQANINCINPPVYTARDLDFRPTVKKTGTLRLGFFGQYRREKNLDAFLDTFLGCRFSQPVELTVQGATVHPDDAADFERIIKKYKDNGNITFWHKGLIGREWQEAIASLDALIMPYAAERYLYHWSAMLFTAIGYAKPVVASSQINPEVLTAYDIGVAFPGKQATSLQEALELFVNTYQEKADRYERELSRANAAFSPTGFVRGLIDIIEGKRKP